jgi:GTPase
MIRGICSHYPDYVMIVIDALRGLTTIGIDQFKLALAFSVPIIIVVTKIDQVNYDQLFNVHQEIQSLIKGSERILIRVDNEHDMVLCSRRITDDNIIPTFCVSNLTGEGLDLFLAFLNLLPINSSCRQWSWSQDDSSEFHITETFVKDGGLILSGMVLKG